MHAPCFFCWVSRQDLLFSLIYRPNWIRHCLISSHLLGTQSVGNIYLILCRNKSINKNSLILETFSCSKKMREKLPMETTFLKNSVFWIWHSDPVSFTNYWKKNTFFSYFCIIAGKLLFIYLSLLFALKRSKGIIFLISDSKNWGARGWLVFYWQLLEILRTDIQPPPPNYFWCR